MNLTGTRNFHNVPAQLQPQFTKNYSDDVFYNCTLFESDNFRVIPSLGAIVEGWLLIIPKKHYLALSRIRTDGLWEEFETLKSFTAFALNEEYGAITAFEHGAAEIGHVVGCGVDYAHLHLVPTEHPLMSGLQDFLGLNYAWEQVDDLRSIGRKIPTSCPYLYLESPQGQCFVTTSPQIPSQAFRKVIAHYMHVPDMYDWKQYRFEENIHNTIAALRKYNHNKRF